jgi:hypothetical protein
VRAEEAATLVGFLKGAFPSMTPEQMEVYENNLLYEDATLASKAILDGIREWKFTPRYAEIIERIRMFRRVASIEAPVELEEPRVYGGPPPFWVRRWVVARYVAKPADMRVFHEQQGIAPDVTPKEGWMPEDAWIEEAEALTPQQLRLAISAHLGMKLP